MRNTEWLRKTLAIGTFVVVTGGGLALLAGSAGCGDAESGHNHSAVSGANKEVAAATTPDANTPATHAQTNCPIMGGKINKAIFVDYQGKRVYFCCAGCPETFKKNPAKYIKEMEDKGIILDKTPAQPPVPAPVPAN